MQGTPGGEAAKRVAQLSMQKLRGLQQVGLGCGCGVLEVLRCAASTPLSQAPSLVTSVSNLLAPPHRRHWRRPRPRHPAPASRPR